MTPESSAPLTPSLPRSLPVAECTRGLERGIRCVLPADPVTLLCQRHDPAQLEARRAQAREAGRARAQEHRRKRLVTPEVEAWAATLDFTTEAGIARALTEVAQRVARRELTPTEGKVLESLARTARSKAPGKPVKEERAPLVVEVERYGNGAPA